MATLNQFPQAWVYNQIIGRQDFIFEATAEELRFQNVDADYPHLVDVHTFNLAVLPDSEQAKELLNFASVTGARIEPIYLLQLMVHVRRGELYYSRPVAPDGLWTVDVRF